MDVPIPPLTAKDFDYVQQAVHHEVWDQAPALVFVADEEMRYGLLRVELAGLEPATSWVR